MNKGELPEGNSEAGGYLVLPRRVAIVAVIAITAAVSGPAIAMYVRDQA